MCSRRLESRAFGHRMNRHPRQFRFAPIVATLLLSVVARGYQASPTVFLKNSEVYVRPSGSSETRQLTKDGLPKGLLTLSKGGDQLAFVRESGSANLADIIIMRTDGSGQREIHFRPVGTDDLPMRGVEKLQWISERFLTAAGSMNPSTCEYAVIDVVTGAEVPGYLTDGFTLVASPDGAHVAYVGFVPHFIPEDVRRPQFCLDDECTFGKPFRGYPQTDAHLEFTSEAVWSPDGSAVAILGADYQTKAESVIVRPVDGKPLAFTVQPGAEGRLSFSWAGNVLVVSAGQHQWKLEPGTSAFVPSR
jgi:hypothetical protein